MGVYGIFITEFIVVVCVFVCLRLAYVSCVYRLFYDVSVFLLRYALLFLSLASYIIKLIVVYYM